MNRHFAAAGFALLGGWSMVSAASADALEDYSFYRIAGGLDDVCHVLKFVERDTIDRLAEEKLGETSQHALMLDGRMSQDEYDVWRDAVHADASAKASEIGCTPAAQSYLLAVRGIATGRLYQDLMLAFHFHGLAEDDVYRIALSPEQISAASGFDGFVKQLYGESFPQFRENQRQAALARMPYIGGSDPLAPEFDVLNNYAEALNPENIEKLSAAAEASSWAVKLIHFEVAAETAGYRVWPLTIQEPGAAPP